MKLPRDISGQKAVKAFEKIGYYIDHQRGSHIILYHKTRKPHRLSIPNHKTLRTGLLSKLIKDAGLSAEQFKKLL